MMFTEPTTTMTVTPAEESGVPPAASVPKHPKIWGREQVVNRANKELQRRVDALNKHTQDVAEAKQGLTQAQHQLGEALADMADSTAAMKMVTKAEARLMQTEATMTVSGQRVEQANLAVQDAERQLRIEREYQAILHLKAVVVPKIELWRNEGRRLLNDELVPALTAARSALAGSAESDTNWINVLQLEFRRHLVEACSALLVEGKGHTWPLRHSSLVNFVPDPETVKTRRRV